MLAEKIASALESQGFIVRRKGNYWYTTTAVCHGGDKQGGCWFQDDGRGGIFAGCYTGKHKTAHTAPMLKSAAGIPTHTERPVSPGTPPPPPPAKKAPVRLMAAPVNDSGPDPVLLQLHSQRLGAIAPPRVHLYRQADGALVLALARYPTNDGKEPRPFTWRGGEWRIGLGGADTGYVLYRLPELLAAPPSAPVLLAEGEKTADALAEAGYCAVAAYGGSSPKDGTDWSPLSGRRVIVAPDYDGSGLGFARRAHEALASVAGSVAYIPPRDLYRALGGGGEPPKGWDFADGGEAAACVDCGGKVGSPSAGRCRQCARRALELMETGG